jgi:hypothetical protein
MHVEVHPVDRARRFTAVAAAAMLVAGCGASSGTPMPSTGTSASASAASGGATPGSTPAPAFSATPFSSLTAAPSVSPTPSGAAWNLAEFGPPASPFRISDIAAGTGGIAAFGMDEAGASFLLTAPVDAATWSLRRADVPGPGRFAAVSYGPSGLHAAIAGEDDSLVLARSTDRGATWTAVATIAGSGANRLVEGQAGSLLVGWRTVAGTGQSAAWLSSDGTRWTEPADLPDFPNPPHAVALPTGFLLFDDGSAGFAPRMAVVSTGGVVAVPAPEMGLGANAVTPGVGPYLPVAVVVADALLVVRQDSAGASLWRTGWADVGAASRFSRVDSSDAQLAGASIAAGAVGPSGAVLLGFDRKTFARFALTSADGAAWTRHPLAADALGGGISDLLVATASGYLAVGRSVTLAGAADDLWGSTNGVAWTHVQAPVGPPPVVTPGPCPSRPTTLAALAKIGAAKAASCFGRSDLTISAYIGTCGGCGGTTIYRWIPDWLGGMFAPLYLAADITTASTGMGDVGPAWPDPTRHLTIPPEKTPVTVTGHYEDPAASSCRVVPFGAIAGPLPSVDEAVMFCRRSLVVTAIAVRH